MFPTVRQSSGSDIYPILQPGERVDIPPQDKLQACVSQGQKEKSPAKLTCAISDKVPTVDSPNAFRDLKGIMKVSWRIMFWPIIRFFVRDRVCRMEKRRENQQTEEEY